MFPENKGEKDLDGSGKPSADASHPKREIKFRAWGGGNMWYEGAFEFQQADTILGDRSRFQLWEFDGIESGVNEFSPIDFDTEIPQVMQFTGLKDKNDREIYEGDVLYFDLQDAFGSDHFHTAEIVMGGSAFGCVLKYRDGQIGWVGLNEIQESDDETEVVGNIYENPDLLTRFASRRKNNVPLF